MSQSAIKSLMHGFFRITFIYGLIGHIYPHKLGEYGHIVLQRQAI